MMRIVLRTPGRLALLAAICCGLAGSGAVRAWTILTHSTGTEVHVVDGELVGKEHGGRRAYYVELVRALLAELRIPDHARDVPFARGLKWVTSEDEVAFFNVSRTPAREDLVRWVGPISHERDFLYHSATQTASLTRLLDGQHEPICVMNGNLHDQLLSSLKFSALTRARSFEHCVRILLAGRVRYLATAEEGLGPRLQAMALPADALVRTEVMLQESGGFIALSPRTSDAELERWNVALDKLRREGVLERLRERYAH